MLTGRRPEALGGLDKDILKKTRKAVAEQLRADEGENRYSGILH